MNEEKNHDLSMICDNEKVNTSKSNECDRTRSSDSFTSICNAELNRLAHMIKGSGIDFMLMTERMSDPVFYLMKTSSIDRCIVANALMETTIRYISECFDGAYIDFDAPEDPYKQIKMDILRDLGYRGEISKSNAS